MNCLICQAKALTPSIDFQALITLKSNPSYLCLTCKNTFIKIGADHCPRCYKSGEKEICQDCQEWERKGIIINHQAIFKYNDSMQQFFSRYKFMGDYQLHQVFKSYFKFKKEFTIVPIPLSPERYQERGFNQVAAFMEKLPLQHLLTKKESRPQSSLTREERLTHTNPFQIKENSGIPEKIIVVDDIYTTGATLVHACKTLKEAGCNTVKTFSLCR